MNKKMSPFWQACWIILCGLLCAAAAVGGRRYHQQKVWHRLTGRYYAYVPDAGQTDKVALTIPSDHRVATLRIVGSTEGLSTHVDKVNRLRINQHRQTMTAIGYPGTPADHYRHLGTTIKLTTEGQTRAYYRQGTPQQQQEERKFQR